MKISVIVTNWNGLRMLKENFENIIKTSPEADEIIFADDASTDESVEYIKSLQKKYKKIKILTHKQNLRFALNSNDAANNASGDLLVFLNNDINPHPGYISACLKHFDDPEVFGVGFAELNNENWPRYFWKEGYLQYERGAPSKKAHITGWLSGGGSIIRKDLFQKLGGFDPVYEPFYSEDLDLGYRAWKSGYKLLWEPNAVVVHNHGQTSAMFSKKFLNYVLERNRLLVILRNITDPDLLRSNKIGQLFRVFTGPNYIKIILAAQRQLKKYPSPIVFPKKTDREIFKLFSN